MTKKPSTKKKAVVRKKPVTQAAPTQPETKAPSGKSWSGKDIVRCFSQADLDAALARNVEIWLCGAGRFVLQGAGVAFATDSAVVEARGSSHVVAWGSSHVEAWESSHVEARGSSHVVAWGSSHVVAWESSHVEARGSSHVEARGSSHVEAWESSHVEARESSHVVAWESSHVEAWGSSHVEARGSSHVEADGAASLRVFDRVSGKAGRQVVIQKHSKLTKIDGGIQIDVELPTTAADWCAWHGVKVVDGVAMVYKCVNDDFRSARGGDYTPGTIPAATDWDGGAKECGGGYHFSPSAAATRQFASGPKFLACPVALTDMRAPKLDDSYANKIKAAKCCGPVVEVDIYGKPVKAVSA